MFEYSVWWYGNAEKELPAVAELWWVVEACEHLRAEAVLFDEQQMVGWVDAQGVFREWG